MIKMKTFLQSLIGSLEESLSEPFFFFFRGNHITQTHPCNILQYFTVVKPIITRRKIAIVFLFLLKTLIMGTR